MKFIDRLRSFMKGRYGPDELYKFLFILYMILFVFNIFLKSNIVTYIELFIIIVMFYRFFSKNIYVRSNENQKFLKIKRSIIKPFSNIKRGFKDKYHVYKRCPKCKTVLKLPLPSKRGFNKAKCPHCRNMVSVFTIRKEKVEVIVKSK